MLLRLMLFCFLLMIASCTSLERGACLQYKTIHYTDERCVPLYGTLICATGRRSRVFCTLYEELPVLASKKTN